MKNIEQIKKAIEVEIKYQYININGKTKSFSSFICSELKNEYKNSKNPKWQILLEHFRRYSLDTIFHRKRSIERLISVIKSDIESNNENSKSNDNKLNLKSDVMYLKGVGPKLGYLLNKLGIYNVADLLFYFPRKHVDYSSRTRIRDLKIGETTTIFGSIKSVEAFNTRNNLGVIKVRISDGSGSLFLSFFVSKSNRYALEKMKSQFPKDSGIMVSGTVKLNSYDGQITIEKPTYSVMDYEVTTNQNLNLARIVPIYPLSENLNIKALRKIIYNAIQLFKKDIQTVLPDYIVKKYHLLEKNEAIEQIHFPVDNEKLQQARFSLVFEEFFLIQLRLAILRAENSKKMLSIPLQIKKDRKYGYKRKNKNDKTCN